MGNPLPGRNGNYQVQELSEIVQVLAGSGVGLWTHRLHLSPTQRLATQPRLRPTAPGKEKPWKTLETSSRRLRDHLGRGLEFEQLTRPEARGGTLTVRTPQH